MNEAFLRLFIREYSERVRIEVVRELRRSVNKLVRVAPGEIKEYWKMPWLSVFPVSLFPCDDVHFGEVAHAIFDGWSKDTELSAIWDRHVHGGDFLVPEVEWASLELIS